MPFPFYLAMTAAEIAAHGAAGPNLAWMACHFSPYSTGLSNCPQSLPEGSMLIVNDRTPVCGHSPEVITEQLSEMVETLGCSRVLLDFQRPGEAETAAIAAAAANALSCPVGVSPLYSNGLRCPVFLPPLPLPRTLREYLAPWQGREVWLEAALDTRVFTVTGDGCRQDPEADASLSFPHRDPQLHCRYRIDPSPGAISFTLHRSREDLDALAEEAEAAGVRCFVGLFQELGQGSSQSTGTSPFSASED